MRPLGRLRFRSLYVGRLRFRSLYVSEVSLSLCRQAEVSLSLCLSHVCMYVLKEALTRAASLSVCMHKRQ
jgi:hypothetical protein